MLKKKGIDTILNSTVNVLETTEIVRRESELVNINLEVIKKYCREWALHPFITPAWDTSVHYDGKGDRLANYILLLDSLNFCFWPDKGQPKWTIEYKGQKMGGYQALAASLKRAIEEGIKHKGFSFIEVLSPCPTTAGRNIFNFKTPAEMYDWYEEQVAVLKPGETEAPDGRIGLGILYVDNKKEELCDVQSEKKEVAKK